MNATDDWSFQQQMDNEKRRSEVTEVLRKYAKGLTSEEGLEVLCRETGVKSHEIV